MKYGKIAMAIVSTLLATSAVTASAGELDGTTAAPHGIIVRVDANGNREVFKADMAARVASDKSAADAASQFVTDANRVAQVTPASELDRTSSTEAWCYWYAPSYYGSYYYSYYSYNYSWNYYPSYSWNWYNYSYYYYWR
jgi:hypothetical protein